MDLSHQAPFPPGPLALQVNEASKPKIIASHLFQELPLARAGLADMQQSEEYELPCGESITPQKATNTGPGVNRGSGGGAQGCGFEERVGAYARSEGGRFL